VSVNPDALISATLSGQDPAQLWNETQGAIQYNGSEDTSLDAAEIRMSQDQEDEPAVAEAKSEDKSEGSAKEEVSGQVDYIPVTGQDGQRQKIKIDWNDKEKIKKQISMAYGARKWQAEKDQAVKRAEAAEKKSAEQGELWSELERAWQGGKTDAEKYAGVIDFISGKSGSANEFFEKYYQTRKARESASPEQLRQIEQEELRARKDAEASLKDQELTKLRDEQAKFIEEVRSKEANALVQPVFDKFSFEGKLGNSEEEGLLNETMWNQTVSRMERDYPENHVFTREELIKEFKLTHTKLNNLIKGRVEKEVTKVIDKKKTEAKSKVQSMAKAGYTNSAKSDEMKELVKKGDFYNLFNQYNKFFK
jgi:hypothetical protein